MRLSGQVSKGSTTLSMYVCMDSNVCAEKTSAMNRVELGEEVWALGLSIMALLRHLHCNGPQGLGDNPAAWQNLLLHVAEMFVTSATNFMVGPTEKIPVRGATRLPFWLKSSCQYCNRI